MDETLKGDASIEEPQVGGKSTTVCDAAEAVASAADDVAKQLLAVACMPGLSHGAFRLYALLAGVAQQKGLHDTYFPITLTGLAKIHPGTAGKPAGFTTIVKQFTELRGRGLVESGNVALSLQTNLQQNHPNVPILVRILHPDPARSWKATDGSRLKVADLGEVIKLQ